MPLTSLLSISHKLSDMGFGLLTPRWPNGNSTGPNFEIAFSWQLCRGICLRGLNGRVRDTRKLDFGGDISYP